jgi:hypothetical protein
VYERTVALTWAFCFKPNTAWYNTGIDYYGWIRGFVWELHKVRQFVRLWVYSGQCVMYISKA